jgi:hypothetical protein
MIDRTDACKKMMAAWRCDAGSTVWSYETLP